MTAPIPHHCIHHDHHGAVIPPRMTKQTDAVPQETASAVNPEDQLRQQVMEEMQEQAALERFQSERPDLWLQTQRISKIMDIQSHCDDQIFPEGACFMHTTAPNYSAFCVKQIMEIDLDTCQVTVEVYGDGEIEEGIVLLPLETISWFGFPKDAIPVHFDFQGFRYLADAHEAAVAKQVGTTRIDKPPAKKNRKKK